MVSEKTRFTDGSPCHGISFADTVKQSQQYHHNYTIKLLCHSMFGPFWLQNSVQLELVESYSGRNVHYSPTRTIILKSVTGKSFKLGLFLKYQIVTFIIITTWKAVIFLEHMLILVNITEVSWILKVLIRASQSYYRALLAVYTKTLTMADVIEKITIKITHITFTQNSTWHLSRLKYVAAAT